MKLRCENFGPIKDGKVDLSKDLIIICGANNSGKTYFSYLLYGLFKANQMFPSSYDFIKNSLEYVGNTKDTITLRLDIAKLLAERIDEILLALSEYARGTLVKIFPQNNLFHDTLFSFEINREEYATLVITDSASGTMAPKITDENGGLEEIPFVEFSKGTNSPLMYFNCRNLGEKTNRVEVSSNETKVVLDIILKNFLFHIFGYMKHPVTFFPAERIAIDLFSKVITEARADLAEETSKNLIMSMVTGGRNVGPSSIIYDQDNPYYALPIQDALKSSAISRLSSRSKGYLFDLGERIEQEILGGQLRYEDSDRDQNIIFDNGKANVNIQLASSVVKSLTPVVLYFKHSSSRNDIFIIDEPELCLHPELQRKLAVILSTASRRGVKVIISTHSDFLIREFNNLIMLHQNSPEAKKLRIKYGAIGYTSDSTLDFNKVGVNMFQKGEIEAINNTESGFEIDMIDDVISAQNQISEDIFFTLY